MTDRNDQVPRPGSFNLDDPRLVATLRELLTLSPLCPVTAGWGNYSPWTNVYPQPAPAPSPEDYPSPED